MNEKNSLVKLIKSLEGKSDISEIIINGPEHIFIERGGDLVRLNAKILSEDIIEFCKDIAKFNKTSFNLNSPIIDGNMPDGSRVNIISSLYTNSSPAITIRRYIKTIQRFDSVEGIFGLSQNWIELFQVMVQSKMNILVSGGTGRGKTTFLNLLLQEVSPTERVITIEDTRELSFDLPNNVRLLAKSNTFDIEKPLSVRDLLRNTLRMRPDRIIIGEVRGEEAFDLLQAMNTGHEGSMCTIHATTPADSLSRLENLFMFAGMDIPIRAIREQVTSAIDFIVQLDKDSDGRRVVSHITEVCNMEGDIILTQNIAKREGTKLEFTGIVPRQMSRLVSSGLESNFFLDF